MAARPPSLKPPSLAHLLNKGDSSPVGKLQQALRAHATLTKLQTGAASADDIAGAALLLSTKRLLRRSPTKPWLIESPLVRPELLTTAQLVSIALLLAVWMPMRCTAWATLQCPWSLWRVLFTLIFVALLTLALHAGGECCYQALYSPLSLPNPSLRQRLA